MTILKTVMRQDWKLLLAERTLLGLALVLAGVVGYSVWNGAKWAEGQRTTQAAAAKEEAGRLAELKGTIRAIESGEKEVRGNADPRAAATIGATTAAPYLTMPPGPLAALVVGLSDLYPSYFKLNLRSRQAVLANDELENPVNLLAGRFDLGFVLVTLFPLLVLALSYNLVSADRENGTLKLAMAQPVRFEQLIAGRILLRAAVLAGLTVVFLLVSVVLAGVDVAAPGVAARLGWLFAVMSLYAAFWFGAAVWMNTRNTSSAANALALAGLWLVVTLVLPGVLNLTATTLYPAPSRVEMISAMRNAGRTAQSQGSALLARYYEDHPELAPEEPGQRAGDFATLSYAVQMQIDQTLQPVLERFDRQIESQQSVVDRFCYLSPAVLVQAAAYDLAGTSHHRYRHFVRQTDRFFETWQGYFLPRIFKKAKLGSVELEGLPRFRFEEEPLTTVLDRVGPLAAGLAVWGLAALGIGFARLRGIRAAE